MPTKTAKPRQFRLIRSKFKGSKTPEKKPSKQLPDTSRIPWFPPLPKTGTDA